MTAVQQHPAPGPPVPMASPPVPAVPVPPAVPDATGGRDVPDRVRRLTGGALAALALMFGLLALGGANAQYGVRVIGHDSGPQVLATAGLYLGLSDMDAQVAGVLLMGKEYGKQRGEAMARYDQRRTEANRALLEAFTLAEKDPAERRTIQAVIDGVGRYERLAAQALLLDSQAGHAPGSPPESVLAVYRQATDLMRLELLPQAYNLTLESGTIVRATHDSQRSVVPWLTAAMLATGLLALIMLLRLQLFLSRAFRRTFSPALLGATAVTLVCLLVGFGTLSFQTATLDSMKSEGFDSVLVLARSRAIGNSLHADQTRYLLDPARSDTYEHAFLDKSQSLFYVEGGNVAAYQKQLASKPKLLGLLSGRRDTSYVFAPFRTFQRADGEMRGAATGGQRATAVATVLGPLSADYDAFDAVLTERAEGDNRLFTQAVSDGDSTMNTLWLTVVLGGIAIALLVIIGVRPRLREYR
ncbi:hypothetical protein OIE66_28855 [Nonomuraea sp. NBC_01738]|uniref:hypothetical protein n=1 Tax=Nonomuraea sp. NBC_01738 TaxID=2976003 RepID=UPI002E0FCB19|nr:hypothetical protein OIE66_28855 [Nonomuraea sp. NBC_01738]